MNPETQPGGFEGRMLAWLRQALPSDRVADVVGDLEEAYAARVQTDSPRRLRRWLQGQVLAFAGWLIWEQVSGFASRRRTRSEGMMSRLSSDIRYAVRSFGRTPGFTLTTIVTLALGIGATTAIFTVVTTVLWRPLDFPDSDRAVAVCQQRPNNDPRFCGASPPNSRDWESMSAKLHDFGIARTSPLLLAGDEGTEIVNTAIATPGFIRTLGFRPYLGRLFDDTDLPPNQHRVIVLTYANWVTRFGADSSVLGRTIVFTGEPYEVIGVLAPDVDPAILDWVPIWRPLPWDPADETNRDWSGFYSIARLEPGATLDDARSEMTTIASQLERAHPVANEAVTVRLEPLREHLVQSVSTQLRIFLGASVLVLLIAAVNVANLLLARATNREKEFAVRASLGASKRRLMRQLLTESFVLSVMGAAAGVLLGQFALQAFVTLAPAGIPRLDEVSLGPDVVGISALLLFITVFAFGLAPSRRATRIDLVGSMKQGGRWSGGGGRLGARSGMIVAEVALAAMLLAGAGLLLRSFAAASRWDPGFDAENLGVVWLLASTTVYPESEQLVPLYDRVVAEVATIPGVSAAGTASAGPLFGGEEDGDFTVAGRPEPAPEDRPHLRWYDVGPDYFGTLRRPIIRGRNFAPTDVRGGPVVALINEAAAQRFFPGEDPLGQRLVDREPFDGNQVSMEIVGVVRDVNPYDPNGVAEPEIYWSNRQRTRWATFIVFRSVGPPEQLFDAVRRRIARVEPTMSVGRLSTIEGLMGDRLIRPRFQMLLLGVFAGIAVLLAVVGTYGVISYAVNSRTQEFGLRISLGAARRDIVALVLRQGATLAFIGLALGLAGALALTRLMQSMLVGVTPRDPMTFVGVALLVGTVVLTASYLPARRAARVDPLEAIRTE